MQRNEDLDFLKGIGIALVVLGHCFTTELVTKYYILSIFKEIIYTFHMPIFFIVSGYLQGLRPYSIDKTKQYTIHQIKRLFIPYIAWSLVLYIFYYLLNTIGMYEIKENISLNPVHLVYSILAYDVRTGNVLWFAYILCIISIVSYISHNAIKNITANILFLIFVLTVGILANIYFTDEMFVLKRFLVMWIYYEVGVFIGIYKTNINIKKANALSVIVLSGLYAIIFMMYLNFNNVIVYGLKIICALLAVFVLYSLSKYNNSSIYRIFNYLGKKTSFIYYLHNPYIVLVLVTTLTKVSQINVLAAIMVPFILGIIIPLIIGELALSRNKVTKTLFLGG